MTWAQPPPPPLVVAATISEAALAIVVVVVSPAGPVVVVIGPVVPAGRVASLALVEPEPEPGPDPLLAAATFVLEDSLVRVRYQSVEGVPSVIK